jgi:2-polyprenyl-6-hydroxyphenyl methylase/3-demethylubiquinone-9 3-methyltransferase
MNTNVHQEELDKFARLAERWWDPDGEMRPLHDINPLRLGFVDDRAPLKGAKVLDVGCGAGILAEAMAAAGAEVTGIDLAQELIEAGRAHAEKSGVSMNYQYVSTREFSDTHAGEFDVVTCMEMLEHVPEPNAVVDDCARLLRPGGAAFFSTINRSPKSWLLAIAGAEYVLGLLPRGTHDYDKLIRPSELADWARAAHLEVREIAGMRYNPFLHTARLTRRPDVNYFVYARRKEGGGTASRGTP